MEIEIDWKNKYFKYKLKYIELKKSYENKNPNTLIGGNSNDKIFDELIAHNLKKNNWNIKTLLLDLIHDSKMQTETNKLINYVISNNIMKPSKKHIELALIYASSNGYYIIVEELIKLGANPNIPYLGLSMIDNAVKSNYHKTAKILMKYGGKSKHFYNHNQFMKNDIVFSNEPENIIEFSKQNNDYTIHIYNDFKDKLLSNSKYNFENLSRNNFKLEFKNKIIIS